jgi:hypothetical protein
MVDVVKARDRTRVRGASSELSQSFDSDGVAAHVGRLLLFWSSSLPDQGHRIVFCAKLARWLRTRAVFWKRCDVIASALDVSALARDLWMDDYYTCTLEAIKTCI